MLERFYRMLTSMPDVETREQNVFFRALFPLRMRQSRGEFLWIVYSAARASFILLSVFQAVLIYRLDSYDHNLTAEHLKAELRLSSLMVSIPILLLIVPYYIRKAEKLVGFSKDLFSRIPLKPTKEHPLINWNRRQIIRRALCALILILFSIPFSYQGSFHIIMHYDALSSLSAIFIITFLYFTLGTAVGTGASVGLYMLYRQYKHHYEEFTENRTD